MGKYISPFVDFGFKYIFGRDETKDFLIDFLNALFENEPNYSPIVELTYLDKEKSRKNKENRGVIYDIHCRTDNGKLFTVEMQNASEIYFVERLLFYSSKTITDQGRPGRDWQYDYLPVYNVALMNFELSRFKGKFRIDGAICDLITHEPITDKVRYILLQLPNFDKRDDAESCKTSLERWMYNIINMSDMESLAFTQNNELFQRLDDVASYAALDEDARREYDADVKAYRTAVGQLKYTAIKNRTEGRAEGRAEGLVEGRAEGRAEMIQAMYLSGMSVEKISKITKVNEDEICRIVGR
ncbi:MAG: Rpn family recombination-promoting nuclease/putative transposase [Muribaculaceae bacterium]|nr:Rpn family recombination-promoting nuclease/putative transposase [Muribaculaceae bacterium]